jgi:hypothetical protein
MDEIWQHVGFMGISPTMYWDINEIAPPRDVKKKMAQMFVDSTCAMLHGQRLEIFIDPVFWGDGL